MSKARVYEVAKMIGLDNKELVTMLPKLGIEGKNHMGSLTEEEVAVVLKFYKKDKTNETGKPDTIENTATKDKESKPVKETAKKAKKADTETQTVKKENKKEEKTTIDNKPEQKTSKTTEKEKQPQQDKQTQQNQQPQKNKQPQQSQQPQNKQTQTTDMSTNQKNMQQKNNKPDDNKEDKNIKQEANQNINKSNNKAHSKKHNEEPQEDEDDIIIKLPPTITVKDLALKLKRQTSEIIKSLFMKKIMATVNQEVPYEMAEAIAEEFGFLAEPQEEEDIMDTFFHEEPDDPKDLVVRPPVVVVMGHVDHGKTSLLDAIRHSNVASGEQGGITQHIGASVVSLNGQKITFLDTPGHEAFTAMRLRGAMATDIAILVVAADDGVMPQTIEAINHAKAANVQIIVAVNKIDKPGANPERVKQELTEYGLVVEEWGGDTICVEVSALTKQGIDQLLEMVLLVAEMSELKANPNKPARGIVIEAQLDKGRGPVATVLVQQGTLRVGDSIIAGTAYGRIRAMMDDKGRRVKQALPSTPVEVLGLSEVPAAGDAFYTAANEKEARMVAERVMVRNKEKLIGATPHKVTLDDLFTQIQAGSVKELKLIVKADVQGSVEAVKQSLLKLSNENVMINVIHGGVGAVTESDVMLASASNAIIIGFNVRPEAQAKIAADAQEIDIRLYRVIYNAIEDIEAAMKGMLDPEYVEKVIGHVEVRQTFKVSGVGTIAGSYVLDGKVTRNSKVRLLRDNIVIYEGELESLKRFKDDVKEVNAGYECGISLSKYNDIKEGDIVEVFVMEEVPR